ncbi:MAG: RDD family protein [Acidobacteriota bacterium]
MDDPQRPLQAFTTPGRPGESELASLSARFMGSLVDGVLGLGLALVLYGSLGIWDQIKEGSIPIMTLVQLSVLGLLFFCLMHGYTLATRGQTLGKVFARTQIVSHEDETILPVTKIILLRYTPITVITMIPVIGNFATLVNIAFVFRDDRRCLHDHIAGTKVIRYPG